LHTALNSLTSTWENHVKAAITELTERITKIENGKGKGKGKGKAKRGEPDLS